MSSEHNQNLEAGGQPGAGGDPAGAAAPDRREFLKQVATVAAVSSTQGVAAADAGAGGSPAGGRAPAAVTFPRKFQGAALRTIAFPLGGVGTGSISLGGRGELRDWEIFNRPDKGVSPAYAFPAIWARAEGSEPVARVLEARIQPPYEGSSGLGSQNVPGLPRLDAAVFTGEFPFARVAFQDAKLPVEVSLEAFSPFIPLEDEASGFPVAVLRYRVKNPGSRPGGIAVPGEKPWQPAGEGGHRLQRGQPGGPADAPGSTGAQKRGAGEQPGEGDLHG